MRRRFVTISAIALAGALATSVAAVDVTVPGVSHSDGWATGGHVSSQDESDDSFVVEILDGEGEGCVSSPHDPEDECYQFVIRADWYCCNVEWDEICQDAYDNCGDLVNGCAPTPHDPEDSCYQSVITAFPYCCEVQWDDNCQYDYEICASEGSEGEGEGCASSPHDPEDVCYQSVIAADPFCCEVNWDGTCQDAYEACDGIPGDFNGDGRVDLQDLLLMLDDWDTAYGLDDLLDLLDNWGRGT